jgi:hypothetical protein
MEIVTKLVPDKNFPIINGRAQKKNNKKNMKKSEKKNAMKNC